jgi:general secretion pathway protein N
MTRMPGRNFAVPPKPWRARLWAFSGIGAGLLLGLVFFAPAQWFVTAVWHASQQHLRLTHEEGSLWHGSAQWALSSEMGGQTDVSLPQRLEWHITPLLPLGIFFQLSHGTKTFIGLEAQWEGTGFRMKLQNLSSQWPAAWLAGLGAPWNTIALDGPITLKTDAVEWRQNPQGWQFEGHLLITLDGISSRLSTVRPLGHYLVNIDGGTNPTVHLKTLQGQLRLNGDGQWQNGQLQFSGVGNASPGHETSLANLLNLLGERRGSDIILKLGST